MQDSRPNRTLSLRQRIIPTKKSDGIYDIPLNPEEKIAKLNRDTVKLINEVSRLRRDIERLNGRIERFDGETSPLYYDTAFDRDKSTVDDAISNIFHSSRTIRDAEFHLNRIRSVMDSIESNSVSRDEMKEWLK